MKRNTPDMGGRGYGKTGVTMTAGERVSEGGGGGGGWMGTSTAKVTDLICREVGRRGTMNEHKPLSTLYVSLFLVTNTTKSNTTVPRISHESFFRKISNRFK